MNGTTSYVICRTTLVQIYGYCGGARLLSDSIDDLDTICDYLRQQPIPWPDQLAESRLALERAVADMYATLARYGFTASALPGGGLEALEQANDRWQAMRLNADPETVKSAIGLLNASVGTLLLFVGNAIEKRRALWQERVVEPLLRGASSNKCRAATAAGIAFDLTATAVRPLLGLAVPPTEWSDDMDAAAEWAAFAVHVCEDLRSNNPGLRVRVTCPECRAITEWHPHTKLTTHGCERPQPGSYQAIMDCAIGADRHG